MIYFIQAGENGLIKIGYSKSPDQRLSKLQTANPTPLKLLTSIEGNIELEQRLHLRFDDFRANGEWFFPCKPLLEYMKLIENNNNEIIKPRKKVFYIKKKQVEQPKLFELGYWELLSSPPTVNKAEYNKLMEEFEIHISHQPISDDYILTFNKKIETISPAYKKWQAQLLKAWDRAGVAKEPSDTFTCLTCQELTKLL